MTRSLNNSEQRGTKLELESYSFLKTVPKNKYSTTSVQTRRYSTGTYTLCGIVWRDDSKFRKNILIINFCDDVTDVKMTANTC